MRYPITPEYLAGAPEKLVELYQDLEDEILAYICEQLQTGDANEKTIELIRGMQRRGLPLEKIEKAIRKTLRISKREYDRLFDGALERNRRFYDGTLDMLSLVGEKARTGALQAEIRAIKRQTDGELKNITRSLGFALRGPDGRVTITGLREGYIKVLDDAAMQIQAGAAGYTGAIRNAIERLTDSGIQWVDYDSGWHNHVDVAVRRAAMTSVSQMSGRYSEELAEEIGAEFVEVSAHRGARDKGIGPENHKSWQGKVYHIGGDITYQGKRYKDFRATTGYGTGAGLNGWNCRHKWYPFVPGVMERSYTDEELRDIDPPPFTFEGRQYNAYDATQKQRELEAAMRNVKRRMIAFKAAGDEDACMQARARWRALRQKYKAFSKAAGLPEQWERAKVYG